MSGKAKFEVSLEELLELAAHAQARKQEEEPEKLTLPIVEGDKGSVSVEADDEGVLLTFKVSF